MKSHQIAAQRLREILTCRQLHHYWSIPIEHFLANGRSCQMYYDGLVAAAQQAVPDRQALF